MKQSVDDKYKTNNKAKHIMTFIGMNDGVNKF